jgi:hypothetical protein
MAEGDDAPHVIVARDGGFVTCLGRGISIGDRPRVRRTELDRLIGESRACRERWAHVREDATLQWFLRRLVAAGPRIAREDFRVIWLGDDELRIANASTPDSFYATIPQWGWPGHWFSTGTQLISLGGQHCTGFPCAQLFRTMFSIGTRRTETGSDCMATNLTYSCPHDFGALP